MAKTSVRLKAIGRSDIAGLAGHNDRKGYTPYNVDASRTVFNIDLIGGNDAYEAIMMDITGCDQARAGKRELVCAEIISSFPVVELLGVDSETPQGAVMCLTNPMFEKWVDTTLEVLRRHGCIHAVLHMDEKTPHIHGVCSVKIKREGAKRDRSGKSPYVLNYAAYWNMKGDKKTKDFYFAAGKLSKRPESLAQLEKQYGMKYDPSATPLGRLQSEFADAYLAVGLDMERGESVLKTHVRHKSHHEKHAEDERRRMEAEIDNRNASLLQEYREQAEKKMAEDRAKIDAERQNIKNLLMAAALASADAEKAKAAAEQARTEAIQEKTEAAKAKAEATREAARIKEQAMADVEAVKAHFKNLRVSGKILFGLDDKARGMVNFLIEMNNAADERYGRSVWPRAHEMRDAIAQAVQDMKETAAQDAGYKEAAQRLKL